MCRTDIDDCIVEWKSKGFKVEGCAADVSTVEGRARLVDAATKAFDGVVDALVNNCGFNIRKPTINFTDDDYRRVMSTNLDSSFFLSAQFHDALKKSGRASIVNVGSVAGGCSITMKSGSVYAMTKAAMSQLTYNLACEWAPDNIRVNIVSPW